MLSGKQREALNKTLHELFRCEPYATKALITDAVVKHSGKATLAALKAAYESAEVKRVIDQVNVGWWLLRVAGILC